jgi:NitT/TauT family transport system permease protein
VGAEIILPSPERTVIETITLFGDSAFYSVVGSTVLRGLAGFCISACLGIAVGLVAGSNKTAHTVISPILSVIRTTPVMSIVLIALIWFHSALVPVFVTLLIAFPIICGNVIEGVQRVDTKLLEMASVFNVRREKVVRELLVPSLFPYLIAGASTALGITWKVVVAAEILSRPARAIGSSLWEAKIRLETAEVFAWTAVAIVLSGLSEAVFRLAVRKIPWARASAHPSSEREG